MAPLLDRMMSLLELPCISVHGSPKEMGEAQGESYREQIQAFVAARLRQARVYLWEQANENSDRKLLTVARQCLQLLEGWDAAGHAEHCGIAAGAGVPPEQLYAAANLYDIRDVVLYKFCENFVWPPPDPLGEGCSALILPPALTAVDRILAGQTWDLASEDVDFVCAIYRMPAEGPETWTVTCQGCQTVLGINEHGVAVGCTNIKTVDAQLGVGYRSVLHRALQAATAFEAGGVIAGAPRAAAHAYWTADERTAAIIECSGRIAARRDLQTAEALCQTNHCYDEMFDQMQAEDPAFGSVCRLDRLFALADRGGHTVESLQALLADRDAGPDSINRHPEDDLGTSTAACFIAVPTERTAWACRGPADRGRWARLDF